MLHSHLFVQTRGVLPLRAMQIPLISIAVHELQLLDVPDVSSLLGRILFALEGAHLGQAHEGGCRLKLMEILFAARADSCDENLGGEQET